MNSNCARKLLLPVVDGVAVAVGLIQTLYQAGLKTSKRGGYAAPLPKIYSGTFARYAPR
jgi:allantoin racemase